MIRPALFLFALLSATPLLACQQASPATNREEHGMDVQPRRAASEVRAVQIVFADFDRTNARLLMDGETVFDGPLAVQNPSVGISRTMEMRIAVGRRTFQLTSGTLNIAITVEIGRETQTIVVNPRNVPYIRAQNGPALFD